MAPKSTPRGLQDAFGARSPLQADFGAFFGHDLDPPEPQKNLKSAVTSSLFVVFVLFGSCPKKSPKKTPKSTQNLPQNDPPEASGGPKMPLRTGARILLKMQAKFGRFPASKWGPKWHPKSLKNRPRRPRPAQERPRAAGRPKKTPPPGGPNSRPSEAHKHTKKLFENTGRKVFRNRFTQEQQTILGSVAGIGGAAPLEIRPLSLQAQRGAVERSELRLSGNTLPKAQRLP